jgi:hypothetical protein
MNRMLQVKAKNNALICFHGGHNYLQSLASLSRPYNRGGLVSDANEADNRYVHGWRGIHLRQSPAIRSYKVLSHCAYFTRVRRASSVTRLRCAWKTRSVTAPLDHPLCHFDRYLHHTIDCTLQVMLTCCSFIPVSGLLLVCSGNWTHTRPFNSALLSQTDSRSRNVRQTLEC